MTTGKIVIAGLDASTGMPLRQLSEDLELEIREVKSFYKVRDELEQEPPLCILANCETSVGQEICLGARISAALQDLPILAVVENPWSTEVRDAFAMGVDDFLPRRELEHLSLKLLSIRRKGQAPAADKASRVVLADPDRDRRVHLARALRTLGMALHFTLECSEVPATDDVRLVVAHCALPPDGGPACMLRHRDATKTTVPWILVGTAADLRQARETLDAQPLLHLFDSKSDATQVVSVANDLLRATLESQRASVRLPYESGVVFNIPGSWQQVWAYTFNISLGGLFVRTVAPPPLSATMELEFCPPFSEQRVRLPGTVVWRQEYTGSRGYPSGFGIQFRANAPERDSGLLAQGYQALLEDQGNPEG